MSVPGNNWLQWNDKVQNKI